MNNIYKGRLGITKISMLGAASAFEESGRKIQSAARNIRELLSTVPPADLQSTGGCHSDDYGRNVRVIREQLDGLEALYVQLAGELRQVLPEVPPPGAFIPDRRATDPQ